MFQSLNKKKKKSLVMNPLFKRRRRENTFFFFFQYFSTVFPLPPSKGKVDHSFIKAKMFLNRDFEWFRGRRKFFPHRSSREWCHNRRETPPEAPSETLQKNLCIGSMEGSFVQKQTYNRFSTVRALRVKLNLHFRKCFTNTSPRHFGAQPRTGS